MLVKEQETSDCENDVGLLIHDYDGCCSETRLNLDQRVEVHENILANAEIEVKLGKAC